MFTNSKAQSVRGYTIYAIIGTTLEVAALLIVLLWVLPLLNIYVPWWIVVILLAVELGVSAFTYIMGRRALSQRLTFAPEFIVGSVGVVTTPFNPNGYVKVRGELWKASCSFHLEVGEEVLIERMDDMKLIVVPTVTQKSQKEAEAYGK